MIQIFENDIKEHEIEEMNQMLLELSASLERVNWERVESVMQKGFLFCARDEENENRIVGMATLVPMTKLAGFFGNVEDVVVLERYRGRKIGKQLMDRIISKAIELEMEHLFLTSSAKREIARNMYHSFGFEEYETTPFKLILKNKENS